MSTLAAPPLPILPVLPASSSAAPTPGVGAGEMSEREAKLREAAAQFESVFIAEMLKHAGLGKTPDSLAGGAFTGGHGEQTFKSFLTREYADEIAEKGGFGLAEAIYQQLKRQDDVSVDGAAAVSARR